MIRGALAAAVTPLQDGGERLDEEAFGPYVDYLAGSGLDGIFALGTTGEGILLSLDERRRAAELVVEAATGRLDVAVHCGAQTTRDTVELCAHAAGLGVDAVAVIGPPYFAFDAAELAAHFAAAACACEPVPFYVYEFEARTGYAVPLEVIAGLREQVSNLAGLKVSDTPFERVEPYLVEGLDVFLGSEPLVPQGLERGAIGTVSGLAAAFPEVVAGLVADPGSEAADRVRRLRDALAPYPFVAAMKAVLAHRCVPVQQELRAPLRPLSAEQRAELEPLLEQALV